MENPCLRDKNIFPDDEVLTACLGKAAVAWGSLMGVLKDEAPPLAPEWRYYNDGKAWLCKVMKKTKTICWISIGKGFFRVTFYFSGKAEDTIANSSLDDAMKEHWLRNEGGGKFRPITLEIRKKSDLKTITTLLALKSRLV